MLEQKFTIADNSPCFYCNQPLSIKSSICGSCKEENPIRCTAEDMYLLFYEGHIIDARAGGLVLGRNHNKDDIPMFAPVAPGIFQVLGLMQGGEFLINSNSAGKHSKRIEEINRNNDDEYTPITSLIINEHSRVFNANGIKGDLSLLIDSGSYIINRSATIRYYEELVDLNNDL